MPRLDRGMEIFMSKYKANETMRLLGHQYWVDAEAREQIDAFLVKKILDFLVTIIIIILWLSKSEVMK